MSFVAAGTEGFENVRKEQKKICKKFFDLFTQNVCTSSQKFHQPVNSENWSSFLSSNSFDIA